MLAVAVLLAGAAAEASAQTLPKRLESALGSSGVAWRSTGVLAVSLPEGKLVYGRGLDRSLLPASNEKLPVAVAALQELGPNYRIPTRVYGEGRLDGSVWRGRLVLKGYGDPTLAPDDFVALARELAGRGIEAVSGGVVGDESYFDRRRTAPGWRPSFYKRECPPLSALIVGRAEVRGRTVDNPALAAAQAFRRALVAQGIRVMGGASVGVASAKAAPLADVFSPRITRIVTRMATESDNFYAEMLLKKVGARELGKGTTPAGASVVRRVLDERGVPLRGVRIVDGSGLSLRDRLTARALVALLVSVWNDAAVAAHVTPSLPLAGVSGTLRTRMRSGPAYRAVRAKTGTTRNASALSGYVKARYAFAILQNGNPISSASARRGQDRFAQVLAGS